MNQKIANFAVLVLIIELILLAIQAEPITATIAYIYAILFTISLLIIFYKNKG